MNILYTTHCPKCEVLKKKLFAAGIEFAEIDDKDIIASKNVDCVPVLEINGETMDFAAAVEWLKNV